MFRNVAFICFQTCHSSHVHVSTQLSFTIRVVGQSSLHRLAFLRIAGPPCLPGFSDGRRWPRRDFSLLERSSCVVPAERDMRRHSFPLTGLRFRPSAMSATTSWTCRQTRALGSPLLASAPVRSFLPVGHG